MSKAKFYLFLLGCALSALNTTAQPQPLDLFQTNSPLEPRRFGDGVIGFIIEGDNHLAKGNWEQAVLAFDNAVTQSPCQADWYVKRAMAKQMQGRHREAREDLELAYRLNPYVAELYSRPNNRRQKLMSQDPLDLLILVSGDSREALPLLQAQTLLLNFHPAEAIAIYDSLLQGREVATADLLHNRSVAYLLTGDIAPAYRDMAEVWRSRPTPDARLFLLSGDIYLLLEAPLMAREFYSQAITRNPELAAAYHNRALASILAYNHPDACYDLEQAARLGLVLSGEILQYFCNY